MPDKTTRPMTVATEGGSPGSGSDPAGPVLSPALDARHMVLLARLVQAARLILRRAAARQAALDMAGDVYGCTALVGLQAGVLEVLTGVERAQRDLQALAAPLDDDPLAVLGDWLTLRRGWIRAGPPKSIASAIDLPGLVIEPGFVRAGGDPAPPPLADHVDPGAWQDWWDSAPWRR